MIKGERAHRYSHHAEALKSPARIEDPRGAVVVKRNEIPSLEQMISEQLFIFWGGRGGLGKVGVYLNHGEIYGAG